MSEKKELMIIDTDCGVDDALALLLAFSYLSSWEIMAITCVHGNTVVDNACNNVLRVMNLCNVDNIPVYRGCDKPLLPINNVSTTVHGNDGLGDVAHLYSTGSLKIQDEHAVNALIRLVKKYPGRIHLVGLAPLTNVAIAHRLDSDFLSNLKSFTIMGGNVYGVGNTNSAAEFNFASDPEAAHIVLSEVRCPTVMIPWETTLKHAMPWNYYNATIAGPGKKHKFMKRITSQRACIHLDRKYKGFVEADFFAVAVLLEPSCIEESMKDCVRVELTGKLTRGHTIVGKQSNSLETNDTSINIALSIDNTVLMRLHKNMLHNVS